MTKLIVAIRNCTIAPTIYKYVYARRLYKSSNNVSQNKMNYIYCTQLEVSTSLGSSSGSKLAFKHTEDIMSYTEIVNLRMN